MSQRLRWILGAAVLVTLVFVCYAPSLPGGFLWDDDSNVTDNPTLRSARGLRYIWTEPRVNQQYYPLTHTSFWVEYQSWELWATGYRITNLLLHGIAAVLLWITLRRLAVPGAWVAAAVFAVHPVNVETAAWITERKNLLSAVLYFGALLAYLRFAGLDGREPPRRRWAVYGASLVLFVAALLSKTAVLTLPAALAVIVWWKRGRLGRADLRPLLPLAAVGAALGAVTAHLEWQHVGAGGAEWDLGPVERVLVAGRALWFYATQLVFPFRLSFIYPRWSVNVGAVWQYVFPLAALGLPFFLWRQRKRLGRGPLAGVLLFGLTVAPALGLLDFYFQLYAFVQDHFQYLASAGLIALLVGLATRGLARRHASAGIVAAGVVLVVLGGLTWQRSAIFAGEETLWRATLERNPRAWMADINLGLLYKEQQRFDEADAHFRHALEYESPEQDKARQNLGRLLEQRGRYADALAQYELALQHNPRNADVHNDMGNLLLGEGREAEAEEHYRAAIEAEPRHAFAHYNLAQRELARESLFEAERLLREALRFHPGYANAADVLAELLAGQQRHDEAVPFYLRALLVEPSRAPTHYNLGLSYEALGNRSEAERHYRAAIALDPTLPEPYNNLAIVLYFQGRLPEARQAMRRFQSLGGAPHPDFLRRLGE